MSVKNFRVVSHETDIELFDDGENMVVIQWDGESREISTYTHETDSALYRGPSLEAARMSLGLTNDEWTELLRSPEYIESV